MIKRFLILLLWPVVWVSAQTSLPTSWNFSSPGITSPPVGWTLMNTLPTSTGGQTYSFGTGDNLSCRFDAQGEYLIIHFADQPGTLSYYVSPQNAGNPWSGLFEVQQSDDGNSWSNLRTFTSQATTSTNFTNGRRAENLSASTRMVRFIFTTKTAGNFALDSVMILPAPPPVNANIQIKKNGTPLVSGSTFVVGKTASQSITIENRGTGESLAIASITFTGKDSADFSVSNVPSSVAAASSANFTLNFTPAQNGSRKTLMHIYSNDSTRLDYGINLYGIGGNFATEPAQPPLAVSITDMKSYGFDVTLSAPNPAPEHYLVVLFNGTADTASPTDGVTYKRGDRIGKGQVLYSGDSAGKMRPTYILANTHYILHAYAFNGPMGFENYLTHSKAYNSITTSGKTTGDYYTGIQSGVSGFVSALTQKINPHDTVFYSQYISRFINPYLTRDTSGGQRVVNCVYTTLPYIYSEPFLFWNGTNGATLTREHTYAQSWMPTRSLPTWPNGANGRELPEYNDLHHLFPADQANGNGIRSNYPFGEVVSNPQPSPTGLGILGKDANGNTVYEPRDEQKGDVARAIFYMCSAYNGINGNNWSIPSSQDQEVLKQWHFQDLPDNFEIARHEYIFSQQHNRNPFIDSVNFVCRIDFRNMTWISNPGACGINEPAIHVTAPYGGEDLTSQDLTLVSWGSQFVDSVKVELYHADTFFAFLGNATASTGKFYWKVGYYPQAFNSSQFKIRVSDLQSDAYGQSEGYFKINFLINGISESALSNLISVYPNPTGDRLSIVPAAGMQIQKVFVYSLQGSLLQTAEPDQDKAQVLLQLYNSGMYILEIHSSRGTLHKRVIRQ